MHISEKSIVYFLTPSIPFQKPIISSPKPFPRGLIGMKMTHQSPPVSSMMLISHLPYHQMVP